MFKLIVPLKSPDDYRAPRLGQERGIVREIDDGPKREGACDDRCETLEDASMNVQAQAAFATDAVHVGDRGPK
jgi:hypothetical protein